MRATFKKIWDILPSPQRRQIVWLFVMSTALALLEIIGVVTIVPFMTVVANPQVLHEEKWLGTLFSLSGAESENGFLFLLGLGVLVVLIVGNAFKALTTWRIQNFTYLAGHVISSRLVAAYLAQPYSYFLTRHSADLGKNVLTEVQQVIGGMIQPGIIAMARGVVVVFLTCLLLVVDPVLALAVVTALGGSYSLIFSVIRKYLTRIGQDRFRANRDRFHVTSEAFSGVKEVKLGGLETAYCARYAVPSLLFAQRQAASQALAQLPRYGLEVIAFGGILIIVLYLLAMRQGQENALPLIALYAFAGYRMLPNLQEVFASLAKMRYARPALDLLHRDLLEKTADTQHPATPPATPLPFTQSIRLKKVTFRYPLGDGPVLNAVSLEIPRGARVGIIGPTGSGKSTVVDLILGLLRPSAGQVLVEDQTLESEDIIRRWQCQIGYVPQHIFLADDTIAANIAFGQPEEAVDQSLVERAARMARLHDFIVSELPGGYDTPIGERGIRLSGGQRQRLGLARALYGDPAVLVLDEATSALDTATEDAVMKALDGVSSDCTVIMIAHRLSTVRRCDILFKMENGRIAARGTYDEVVGVNN